MRPTSKAIGITSAVLLLSACGNSDELTQDQPALDQPSKGALFADDPSLSLENSIVTGINSSNNETHWNCTLSNGQQSFENYLLTFLTDKTGIAGKENMSWFVVDEDTVSISWDLNRLYLSNFIFTNNAENIHLFSATSDRNDRLDCILNGPKPLPNSVLADFTSVADPRIVNDWTNQQDVWSCEVTDNNGVTTEDYLTFWSNGNGKSTKGNFSWYYNDDDNIITSYIAEIREIRSIRFLDTEINEDRSENFTAFDRQNSLNCKR